VCTLGESHRASCPAVSCRQEAPASSRYLVSGCRATKTSHVTEKKFRKTLCMRSSASSHTLCRQRVVHTQAGQQGPERISLDKANWNGEHTDSTVEKQCMRSFCRTLYARAAGKRNEMVFRGRPRDGRYEQDGMAGWDSSFFNT